MVKTDEEEKTPIRQLLLMVDYKKLRCWLSAVPHEQLFVVLASKQEDQFGL